MRTTCTRGRSSPRHRLTSLNLRYGPSHHTAPRPQAEPRPANPAGFTATTKSSARRLRPNPGSLRTADPARLPPPLAAGGLHARPCRWGLGARRDCRGPGSSTARSRGPWNAGSPASYRTPRGAAELHSRSRERSPQKQETPFYVPEVKRGGGRKAAHAPCRTAQGRAGRGQRAPRRALRSWGNSPQGPRVIEQRITRVGSDP